MYQQFGNFINGKWSNNSENSIKVINPFNEEVLGSIPVSTEKDLNEALEAAHHAFTGWRNC